MARILVVDDKPNMRSLCSRILADLGEVVTADGGRRAMELLDRGPFDVVISDIRMPDIDGQELLRRVRQMPVPPEFILMTAYATVETAVEALRLGAYDYLTKPFDPDDARAVVQRALSKRGAGSEPPSAKFPAGWQGMVGCSSKMQAVFALLTKVAPSDAPVLLLGESGTGKELLARAIHEASPRASKRFVAVNCAAIPATLMESELFGYAKGAFSGAIAARSGLFEEADGGTLFLDEIGDMRRALQAKLTRALEERAVRRIGESEERRVDVRIVSATHRALPALVAQGAFREDLFYRVNTCMVTVPPLREREGDLPLLVEHFLSRASSSGKSWEVTPSAMAALVAHSWPGNVRELRSVLERAALVSEDGRITRSVLPSELMKGLQPAEPPAGDLSDLPYRDAIQRLRIEGVKRYLEAVLRRCGGNVTAAAEHADVERESFYRLCRQHGVNPTEFRGPDDGEKVPPSRSGPH
jgi:two-component system response regulator HydG